WPGAGGGGGVITEFVQVAGRGWVVEGRPTPRSEREATDGGRTEERLPIAQPSSSRRNRAPSDAEERSRSRLAVQPRVAHPADGGFAACPGNVVGRATSDDRGRALVEVCEPGAP